jgi:hypothetical protein
MREGRRKGGREVGREGGREEGRKGGREDAPKHEGEAGGGAPVQTCVGFPNSHENGGGRSLRGGEADDAEGGREGGREVGR